MTKSSLIKSIVSAIAILNIVGILCFYVFSVRMVSPESENKQESSAYVSTSYNVAMDDESEESDKGTTEEVAEEEEVLDPTIYPTLELTDKKITLTRGERFNFLLYLKTYRDVDGSDLSHYIRLDGEVNTYQVGTYVVTYSVTSRVTRQDTSVDLTIEVVEPGSQQAAQNQGNQQGQQSQQNR